MLQQQKAMAMTNRLNDNDLDKVSGGYGESDKRMTYEDVLNYTCGGWYYLGHQINVPEWKAENTYIDDSGTYYTGVKFRVDVEGTDIHNEWWDVQTFNERIWAR